MLISAMDIKFSLLLVGLFYLSPIAQVLSDPYKGRMIYQQGITIDNASASIAGGMRMDVKSFPCQSCHRQDGSGGFEGGVNVPSISWGALTKRRPTEIETAYTKQKIKRAIISGVNSKGEALHPLMPSYTFSDKDLNDLLDYLEHKNNIPKIGITNEEITVGVIITNNSAFDKIKSVVKTIFETYFNDVNKNGGIHGRKITLEFFAPDNLEKDVLFYTALAAPFNELKVSDLVKSENTIPILFPINQIPEKIKNTVLFQASFADQLSNLLTYKKQSQEYNDPIEIIIDKSELGRQLEWRFKEADALSKNVLINSSEGTNISNKYPEAIFWFSRKQDFNKLLSELNKSKSRHVIYSSIDLVGTELYSLNLPQNIRLILSNPRGTPELDSKEYQQFINFQQSVLLTSKYSEWQRMSYIVAKLITHTLKASGRRLNRQILFENAKLINSLRNGVMPMLSTGDSLTRPSQIVEFDGATKSLISLIRWGID